MLQNNRVNSHKILESTRILKLNKLKSSSVSIPKSAAHHSTGNNNVIKRREKTKMYHRMKLKKPLPPVLKQLISIHRLQEQILRYRQRTNRERNDEWQLLYNAYISLNLLAIIKLLYSLIIHHSFYENFSSYLTRD